MIKGRHFLCKEGSRTQNSFFQNRFGIARLQRAAMVAFGCAISAAEQPMHINKTH